MDRAGRNTTLLYAGQFVSQMGDAVHLSAIAWLVASLTGSAKATGTVVAIATVPFLLLGPFAGAWVDRGRPRRILVTSDLVRAALLLAFPFVASRAGLSFPLVAGVTLLVAAASTPFLPARDALIPVLAEGRSLVRYNAAFQTSGQLAQLSGLFLGGLLLGSDPDATSRVVTVLALDGVTFVVSAVTLLALVVPAAAATIRLPRSSERIVLSVEIVGMSDDERRRRIAPAHERIDHGDVHAEVVPGGLLGASDAAGPPSDAGSVAARPSLVREALEGLRHVGRDPLLVGLLVLTALDNLAIMGPAIVGATHLVRDDMGLGPAHVAWFEGAMAAGFLVGALVLARTAARWRKGPLILVGMLLDGLTYLPFAASPPFPVALALIFVHGLFIPCIVVGRTSLLQEHVPRERIGRTFALVHLTVTGMTTLSAIVAGHVAAAYGAPTLFLGAGALGTACGLAGLLGMPRLRRAA